MSSTAVSNAPAPDETASNDVLVHPGWLEAHLHDPSVRVIEVDVSRAAYDRWHIDGAVLWNVYADLKDSGYQLVSTPAVRQLFERSRISRDTTVVFYGYAPAMGLWLMKLYGHPDVRILDCSRDTWQREGRPCLPRGTQDPEYFAGESAVRLGRGQGHAGTGR